MGTIHTRCCIAGGGPAGFFAAIRCAELNPKLRILIVEKSSQTLGKVLISGGGRCNVTHACFEPAQLITYYPRGGNELRHQAERALRVRGLDAGGRLDVARPRAHGDDELGAASFNSSD